MSTSVDWIFNSHLNYYFISVELIMASFLFFFILLLLGSAGCSQISSPSSCSSNFLEGHPHLEEAQVSGGIILPLHHAHGPCSTLNVSPSAAATDVDLIRYDAYRVNLLTSRLLSVNVKHVLHHRHHNGRHHQSSSTSIPLDSGFSVGVGNFVSKIGLGTPAKEYIMVVDTGSSLTWLQCQPCVGYCYKQEGPIFNPNSSSTYSSVTCSAPECSELKAATLNPSACSRNNVCTYQASYGDSSFSVGYLVKDSLSFGKSTMASSFVYGCGQNNRGLFGKAAGLIGLSKDKLSMLSQLSTKTAKSFSYCLPTRSSSGYLSIGSAKPGEYTYTPMVANSLDASLYYLNLTDITVGSESISVPASTYTSFPTIIDSGTVITRLPTSIYTALSKAVSKSLSKHKKAPAFSILDTCFKGAYKSLPDPKVSLVFAGGAKLTLAPINAFYDLPSKGITCLAFAGNTDVGIIGNTQQLTFSFSYDVAHSRLGFAPGGCT